MKGTETTLVPVLDGICIPPDIDQISQKRERSMSSSIE